MPDPRFWSFNVDLVGSGYRSRPLSLLCWMTSMIDNDISAPFLSSNPLDTEYRTLLRLMVPRNEAVTEHFG